MLDKSKGNKKQERHFQSNMRVRNAYLAVLTTASDALLVSRRNGLEPFTAVFDAVGGEGRRPSQDACVSPVGAVHEDCSPGRPADRSQGSVAGTCAPAYEERCHTDCPLNPFSTHV
jgi:hypothetical protein